MSLALPVQALSGSHWFPLALTLAPYHRPSSVIRPSSLTLITFTAHGVRRWSLPIAALSPFVLRALAVRLIQNTTIRTHLSGPAESDSPLAQLPSPHSYTFLRHFVPSSSRVHHRPSIIDLPTAHCPLLTAHCCRHRLFCVGGCLPASPPFTTVAVRSDSVSALSIASLCLARGPRACRSVQFYHTVVPC